jgi:hypothetical protein
MNRLGQGCGRMDWKRGGIHFGGYAGLRAEVGQVGRKAVAQVKGGGRKTPALQP